MQTKLIALAAAALTLSACAGSPASEPATTSTTTVTAPPETSTTTATAAATTVTKTRTKTVTAEPPAPENAFPGDGTYQVGLDIEPGTYVSEAPPSGNCYWARLSGSDGFDSIIDNNNSAGQSVVTVKPSDKFFETSGCSQWVQR